MYSLPARCTGAHCFSAFRGAKYVPTTEPMAPLIKRGSRGPCIPLDGTIHPPAAAASGGAATYSTIHSTITRPPTTQTVQLARFSLRLVKVLQPPWSSQVKSSQVLLKGLFPPSPLSPSLRYLGTSISAAGGLASDCPTEMVRQKYTPHTKSPFPPASLHLFFSLRFHLIALLTLV